MMKITPPARTSSPQTHLSIPIFGLNRASGHSSIPPFKPFSADMAARYATVRASFAGKIAKYVGKVDTFADVIVSYSRKKGFAGDILSSIVANKASTAILLHRTSRKRKSDGVIATPPLRILKNLTNYFFSLNISWQAFQS
jgi:hypothetical protein